jgi:hypothetical protein
MVARSAAPRDGVGTVCTSRNLAAIKALVSMLLRLYLFFSPQVSYIYMRNILRKFGLHALE